MKNSDFMREVKPRVEKENPDMRLAAADLICFCLSECDIHLTSEKRFFVDLSCMDVVATALQERYAKLGLEDLPEEKVFAFTGSPDFGHTSPDWETVISLGIYGLRQRVQTYFDRNTDPEKTVFYTQTLRVYDAALSLLERVRNAVFARGYTEMADGLTHLLTGAPTNLYEAMQTTIIYYTLQQHTEHAVLRTLGRLDSLYRPFYTEGLDEEYVRGLIRDFYREIDAWNATANIPFALGADAARNTASSPLTLLFLKEYRAMHLPNTKIHLLCRADTPDEILKEAFSSVREGKNSILFMSDSRITASLVQLGEDPVAAADYHVVGCYECGGKEEITCSCNACLNLPKALEYALTGGVDLITGDRFGLPSDGSFEDFDSLFAEFLRQANHLIDGAMEATSRYERAYPHLFAAPFLSSTYRTALEKGGDVYADYAARYNNSSLNALGLATVTDALSAIRKLVYEEHMLTLSELTEILRANWNGHEVLLQTIRNRFPKYGQGNDAVDSVARSIVSALGASVDGRKNVRGGVWRLGLFSIDWRWDFGAHTGASADGRRCGEPLSQNTGADFGRDRYGATAHMLSVAGLDSLKTPNGSVLDLDIHISAVSGEDGLQSLLSGVRAFFALGGFAVHYNILDTEILRKAKASPADYPNLQVRLCGWNVLFNTLSEKEKDEFIARFEHQGNCHA